MLHDTIREKGYLNGTPGVLLYCYKWDLFVKNNFLNMFNDHVSEIIIFMKQYPWATGAPK